MQYIILAKLTLAASEFFCCQRRKLSESQHHTTVTQKKLLILRVQFLHIVLATYSDKIEHTIGTDIQITEPQVKGDI